MHVVKVNSDIDHKSTQKILKKDSLRSYYKIFRSTAITAIWINYCIFVSLIIWINH